MMFPEPLADGNDCDQSRNNTRDEQPFNPLISRGFSGVGHLTDVHYWHNLGFESRFSTSWISIFFYCFSQLRHSSKGVRILVCLLLFYRLVGGEETPSRRLNQVDRTWTFFEGGIPCVCQRICGFVCPFSNARTFTGSSWE